jgi:antitoxin ParD1/3/4
MYNSASEVVREGLRLLQQRDELRDAKLKALRSEIQEGIDDLEAGRSKDGRKFMDGVRGRLIKTRKNG